MWGTSKLFIYEYNLMILTLQQLASIFLEKTAAPFQERLRLFIERESGKLRRSYDSTRSYPAQLHRYNKAVPHQKRYSHLP